MTKRTTEMALAAIGAACVVAAGTAHGFHLSGRVETWTFVILTLAQGVACFACALRLLGGRATAWLLGLSLVMGWGWEQVGVATGLPFGRYTYTDVFGTALGLVPLIIPVAWFVVITMTYVITNLLLDGTPVSSGGPRRIAWSCLVGGFVTTAFDLPADPFMVQTVKAWIMLDHGPFFGEQFRGFQGWVIVSFTISLAFRLIHRRWCPEPPKDPPFDAALIPLLLYASWGGFFAIVNQPPGVRVVAAFAMGLPVLVAGSRLLDWSARRRMACR